MSSEFSRLRICIGKNKNIAKKIFWLAHGTDGSVMVELPYAKTKSIYFGKFVLPPGAPRDIDYAKEGIKTDIIPKFNYHGRSGDCQFSKTGHIKRSYVVSRPPIKEINKQTHIFTLYLNGYPNSFENYDESATKKRDLKDKIFNVVFDGKHVNLAANRRHRFKFLIEPAVGFTERHDIKKDSHFYPSQHGDVVYNYNLFMKGQHFKCLLAYNSIEVKDNDEHFVFFGGVDAYAPGKEYNDFLFIIGNA